MKVPTDIPLPDPLKTYLEFSTVIGKWGPLLNKAKIDCQPTITKIIEATLYNFECISVYMDREVYSGLFKGKKRNELNDLVQTMADQGSTTGWFVGREWGSLSPSTLETYRKKGMIFPEDVPDEAEEALEKAAYIAYYPFAHIMIGYYRSSYTNLPQQKDPHLIDTFNGIYSKGIIQCFMMGVQSNDKY